MHCCRQRLRLSARRRCRRVISALAFVAARAATKVAARAPTRPPVRHHFLCSVDRLQMVAAAARARRMSAGAATKRTDGRTDEGWWVVVTGLYRRATLSVNSIGRRRLWVCLSTAALVVACSFSARRRRTLWPLMCLPLQWLRTPRRYVMRASVPSSYPRATRGALLRSVLFSSPAPTVGGIKRWCAFDVWRLSLSRTSGLSREQRGLERLKLAQR